MDFFVWQGVRRQHSELCNDEQHDQAKKDAIYSRRFSLTDYYSARIPNMTATRL